MSSIIHLWVRNTVPYLIIKSAELRTVIIVQEACVFVGFRMWSGSTMSNSDRNFDKENQVIRVGLFVLGDFFFPFLAIIEHFSILYVPTSVTTQANEIWVSKLNGPIELKRSFT